MKTQIFAYKGIIGMVGGSSAITKIGMGANGPTAVTKAPLEDVEFSQAAVDILKTFPKTENDHGNFFLHTDDKGKKSVVWAGQHKSALSAKEALIYNDFAFDELTIADIEVPQDFKEYVNTELLVN